MIAAADILLRLERVSRHFSGLHAVEEVSLAVRRGELVGLIGPNGAGKTTLFNLIAGALAASSGALVFDGRPIGGLSPAEIARLGIARTYQNVRVFPDITVFDNVSIGAAGRHGVTLPGALIPALARRPDARIAEATIAALARFGLAAEADLPAGNLAYGRKKLLEIARAVTLEPKLLLLDEPAAGLDPSETAALARLVRELCDEGITVLLVEHDLPMVMQICDRIVVLDSGRKIADGPPASIRADAAVRTAYLGNAP